MTKQVISGPMSKMVGEKALIFDQMAGLGIQGSKITKLVVDHLVEARSANRREGIP